MKKTTTVILLAAIFIIGFLIFYRKPAVQNTPTRNQTEQSSATQKWETKTDNQASVNIVVTPFDLGRESTEWKFNVSMNTHSVELGEDLTQSAVLIGDDGKEYKPVKWEGSPGGHHREGVLSFASIIPYPQYLTLQIKNIGGVERSFSWTLNR